jgi:hypothetical protein
MMNPSGFDPYSQYMAQFLPPPMYGYGGMGQYMPHPFGGGGGPMMMNQYQSQKKDGGLKKGLMGLGGLFGGLFPPAATL